MSKYCGHKEYYEDCGFCREVKRRLRAGPPPKLEAFDPFESDTEEIELPDVEELWGPLD